jgi:hypothetical protein
LTTIVTDSHATSRIGDAKLKDIPSRADTSSSLPYPIHDINHGFSDSDLTEIDDDESLMPHLATWVIVQVVASLRQETLSIVLLK